MMTIPMGPSENVTLQIAMITVNRLTNCHIQTMSLRLQHQASYRKLPVNET